MTKNTLKTKVKRLHQRLNGCTIEFDLSQYYNLLDKIKNLDHALQIKSDKQLQQISERLKSEIYKGYAFPRISHEREFNNQGISEQILIEAYALVREAAWRILKMRPFDVQVLGALVMHQGKLAEMQTGEGKTLTAVFPAYLNALTAGGVHVLTFNDYLARRDAQWMGPIYQFLGLTVGYVQEGMSIEDRQNAYAADITYLTAKESGFDYLRDTLCYEQDKIVHRPFNFAIIDEADSILIDEARIPLVIAGAADDYLADTYYLAKIARKLENNIDFEFDEHIRNIHLTDSGQDHVEKLLDCGNLYDEHNFELLTRLNCALHAEFMLHKDSRLYHP